MRQINLSAVGFSMGFAGLFFYLCMMNICCSPALANLVIWCKSKKWRRNLDNSACSFHCCS